jgi:hypothetical protein
MPAISDLEITELGVIKLLNSLKAGKASGVDLLTARPLKECADSVTRIVTFIFNQSISEGTLPEDWVSANIAPIYKKGLRDLPENYRPVY